MLVKLFLHLIVRGRLPLRVDRRCQVEDCPCSIPRGRVLGPTTAIAPVREFLESQYMILPTLQQANGASWHD